MDASSTDSVSGLKSQRSRETTWWLCFSLYALIAIAAWFAYRGPRYSGQAAATADRTIETLRKLIGPEQLTHPGGSEANIAFRHRLVAELESNGLDVTLAPFEDAGVELATVVARSSGKKPARPIVFATHYDSCRFGPGASDAGVCVAALVETAKVVATESDHEMWFLFTDGEERGSDKVDGLRGALNFVSSGKSPWGAAESPFVISFDARGNRDSVLLYETDRKNLASIRLAASALPRPLVTSSLMVNVYDQLPNGTDFTVYKHVGWQGWNFALISGAEHYHQPSDTVENLNPRSAAHFTQHGIQAARIFDQLGNEQLKQLNESEPATFFDILGQFVIIYPTTWDWGLLPAAICLASIAAVTRGCLLRKKFALAARLVASVLLNAVAGALICYLASAALQFTELLPRRFVDGGELIAQAYLLIAATWMVTYARRALSDISIDVCLVALAFGSAGVGAVMLFVLPGGAYLAIWSSIWVAILAILSPFMGHRTQSLLVSSLPSVLLAPSYVLLVRALGPAAGAPIGGAVALLLVPTLVAFASPNRIAQEAPISA